MSSNDLMQNIFLLLRDEATPLLKNLIEEAHQQLKISEIPQKLEGSQTFLMAVEDAFKQCENGRTEEGLAQLHHLRLMDPLNWLVPFTLAASYLNLKQYREASMYSLLTMLLTSERFEACFFLYTALLKMYEFQPAFALYCKIFPLIDDSKYSVSRQLAKELFLSISPKTREQFIKKEWVMDENAIQ